MRRQTRGVVTVEYAFLLTFVAIPTVVGIIAGGAIMLRDYHTVQLERLEPVP